MSFRDLLGKRLLFFDGAMGTMLQDAGLSPGEPPDLWNLTHPSEVKKVHEAYLRAGCNILVTNSFGTNALKLEPYGVRADEIARAAVKNARAALSKLKNEASGEGEANALEDTFIAFDIGPSGRLLKPLGDLDFEEAYGLFSEAVSAASEEGVDLILIETMSDTYELKAALLAAKESGLPVVATVTLNEKGRLLTGADIKTAVALIEGLGADALGLNCGTGPREALAFLEEFRSCSSLPLVLSPNAGLPHEEEGKTLYDSGPDEFAGLMRTAAERGAQLLGGCCGTTPEHMKALISSCRGLLPVGTSPKTETLACSFSHCVSFEKGPVLIGERINPTGKPRMQKALRDGDTEYIIDEALSQADADILDLNAGLPDIDEEETLCRLVREIQSVSSKPLCIDSTNTKAMERALRVYNGKPLINSVNGREDSMAAVFPLAKKYGGLIIALTLDEKGIPESAEGRAEIAGRILKRAREYGIEKKDIIFDTLTLALSAGADNALNSLGALKLIRRLYQAKTVLGVSNISFGLPEREALNAAFLTLAVGKGLSAAIMNPKSEYMMKAFRALKLLYGRDADCNEYISAYGGKKKTEAAGEATGEAGKATGKSADKAGNAACGRSSGKAGEHDDASETSLEKALYEAVCGGIADKAKRLAREALLYSEPLELMDTVLIPALDSVGSGYEEGSLYLPQLLLAAEAAKAAFAVVKEKLSGFEGSARGTAVLATVKGDIHDIGKNIVCALLENYRFRVIDLGRDVAPERVLAAVKEYGAGLVGLSALMTTTVGSMEETVRLLKQSFPKLPVMCGGAVLTEEYVRKIGADLYAKDAMAAVRFAEELFS